MTDELNENNSEITPESGDENDITAEIEEYVYTLTDEDGNEARFELAGTTEQDGSTYYALIPSENDGDEYVILKAEKDDSGEDILVTIDDDDEFDRISAIFDNELFGEIDYDGTEE